MSESHADVLIVGAGPTGLVLALWLTRFGVSVRVIDKAEGPGTTSRAVAVQARTLEFYDQVGLAKDVVSLGRRVKAANLWVRGHRAARVPFADLGAGLSPFPYAVLFPQDEHERLLINRLAPLGVDIGRRTELAGFDDGTDNVGARLLGPDGRESVCHARYIVGCDGAHSTVRRVIGADFPGGTYEHLFYVADVEASGPPMDGDIHVALEPSDFLAVFPLKDDGHARFIGTVRGAPDGDSGLSWSDVSRTAMERLHADVRRVAWFSTYRVHHRVAARFRKGRAFLAGDAAHIHSPVGGQGMNTGIGDAVNLAWKLAAVVKGRAQASILETYEPERIAFARRLVSTTDRAFTAVTSASPLARFLRLDVVPALLPPVFALQSARRLAFRTVSQTAIAYQDSALSVGRAGAIAGGDRLPWVADATGRGEDNFAPLRSLDWQIHAYGSAGADIEALCRARALALHIFPWTPAAGRAGLARNAVYLVRPDGHVALAQNNGRAAAVAAYLDGHGFAPIHSRD